MEDRRPTPPGLQGLLTALLGAAAAPGPAGPSAGSPGSPPTLRAFTDGEDDHVALLVSTEALAAGLEPGVAVGLDDVVVEVDGEPDRGAEGERWSVLVSRPVRHALEEPVHVG